MKLSSSATHRTAATRYVDVQKDELSSTDGSCTNTESESELEILPLQEAAKGCKRFYKGDWSLSVFIEFYDRVLGATIMEHFGILLAGKVHAELLRRQDTVGDVHLLEVAAGTGRITKHIYNETIASPHVKAHCTLTATDMSAIAMDRARKILPTALTEDTNVKLVGDVDMVHMPDTPDRSVDVIICGFGLMYPKDKYQVVREFQRVLRPGGKVYCTMFKSNTWFEAAQEECNKQFGAGAPMLQGALRLVDPGLVVNPFTDASMSPDLQVIDYEVQVTTLDTEELLYNVCILMEEFNQQSFHGQEKSLQMITETMHRSDYAKNLGNNRAGFPVKVWMLECTQPLEAPVLAPSHCISETVGPRRLGLEAFHKFRDGTLEEKKFLNEQARISFLQRNPAYDEAAVDAFRAKEFARLDKDKETYLDFVGGSLPPLTVLNDAFEAYQNGVAGNPHSAGKKSRDSLVQLREAVMRFFRCDNEDDYEMILTPNASGAITIVAECFSFKPGSAFILTRDNHTSVHSIRLCAQERGANTRYVVMTPDLLIWDTSMERALDSADPSVPNLLAYPAQSNATGVKHDLSWVTKAQEKGFFVLLDAAAYCPTAPMDLSRSASCRPDFIPMSFYKIFGYPTGFGCLLAKKSALTKLDPTGMRSGSVCYFSGPWSPKHRVLRYDDARRFENGTPNYLAMASTTVGFKFIQEVGVATIGQRARCLARWLEVSMSSLSHQNGLSFIKIYDPPNKDLLKGATIMCNFWGDDGSMFPFKAIEALAAEYGISMRTGCFCNMGIVQHATYKEAGSEHCELDRQGEQINTCSKFQEDVLGPGHCGAIRISFGMGSTFNDAYSFYLFAQGLLNRKTDDLIEEVALANEE